MFLHLKTEDSLYWTIVYWLFEGCKPSYVVVRSSHREARPQAEPGRDGRYQRVITYILLQSAVHRFIPCVKCSYNCISMKLKRFSLHMCSVYKFLGKHLSRYCQNISSRSWRKLLRPFSRSSYRKQKEEGGHVSQVDCKHTDKQTLPAARVGLLTRDEDTPGTPWHSGMRHFRPKRYSAPLIHSTVCFRFAILSLSIERTSGTYFLLLCRF